MTREDNPYDEIKAITPNVMENIDNADVCVVFAGLPDKEDSEGKDRTHLCLPDEQNALIDEAVKAGKPVVVVLMNGSAVEMPWIQKVNGVIEAYLGGQGVGNAIAKILFGEVNPSGKLAETFPVRLNDTPCYMNFPGEKEKVEYREGIFVGYRYYDGADVKPLFPFGHGLSYTEFAYSDLILDKSEMSDDEVLTVTVKVKNIGKCAGKEIVQLYVRDVKSDILRPDKELKGFEKIELLSDEEKIVKFELGKRSFAFYDVDVSDWRVESGDFEILIGKSSADIVLSKTICVNSTTPVKKHYSLDSTLYDIKDEPAAAKLLQMMAGGTSGGTDLGMDIDAVLSSIKIRSLVPMSLIRGESGISLEQLKDLIAVMNT